MRRGPDVGLTIFTIFHFVLFYAVNFLKAARALISGNEGQGGRSINRKRWLETRADTREPPSPQYNHPTKRGVVTVPGKPNDDLAPGTLNSILKQAGLK